MDLTSSGHASTADIFSSPQLGLGFDDTVLMPDASPAPKARKARAGSPSASSALPPESMAALLDSHPDYRVLRRLPVTRHFSHEPQGPVRRLLILDTETTGLDHSRDRIMELALLRVDVCSITGLPTGTVEVYNGLEDPGMPIPAEIQAITGINDEMVRGHRLDEVRVMAMLHSADLVVAHNAGFDRPFAEARLAGFSQLAWGCSFADLDWKKEGCGSAKLTQLALERGWFYDAHRAEMDCHALLAVLAAPLPVSGLTGLAHLLAACDRPSFRLQATSAPFDAKDVLKARGYRWDGQQRVWHTRLTDEAGLQAECDWLKRAVYANRAASVQLERLDAGTRYSARPGLVEARPL